MAGWILPLGIFKKTGFRPTPSARLGASLLTPPGPTPPVGSQARKFLQQIPEITLQLNRQTQHSVPSKKVPSERKQSSAGPAGEQSGRKC